MDPHVLPNRKKNCDACDLDGELCQGLEKCLCYLSSDNGITLGFHEETMGIYIYIYIYKVSAETVIKWVAPTFGRSTDLSGNSHAFHGHHLGCLSSASFAVGSSALHRGLVSQHQLKNSPGFCSFSWTLGTSGTLTATGLWSVPNTRFCLFSLLIASCRLIGLPICSGLTFSWTT